MKSACLNIRTTLTLKCQDFVVNNLTAYTKYNNRLLKLK